MDLRQRSTLPERMDDADVPADVYARCLRDLAAVNRLTFTHRPTLHWLDQATRDLPRAASLSVLDVAYGQGDLLRAIRRWSERRGLNVALAGIDLNPRSAAAATAATPASMAITFHTGDVFDHVPDPLPDFIVTSQFAHHLTDAEVIQLLFWLEAHARRGWFIADLHRHALAYHGFPVIARIAGWQPIVRTDGAISIARSFRRTDWQRYLDTAAIPARVAWRLPFRYCVARVKAP